MRVSSISIRRDGALPPQYVPIEEFSPDLYLDFGRHSLLTFVSGKVSAVTPVTGGGTWTVAQTTAANRPTWEGQVAAFGGRPGLKFVRASAQYLKVTGGLFGTGGEFYIVASLDSGVADAQHTLISVDCPSTAAPGGTVVAMRPSASYKVYALHEAVAWGSDVATEDWRGDGPRVANLILTGAASTSLKYEANSAVSVVSAAKAAGAAQTVLGCGWYNTPTAYWTGYIGSVVYFATPLSSGDRAEFLTLLTTMYGALS